MTIYDIGVVALSALFAAACGVAAQSPGAQNTPGVIEPAIIDFGVISGKTASLSRTAVLRNVGPDAFKVNRVYAGCGCIQATLIGGPDLKPGESRNVRFDIDLKKTKYTAGKQQHSVVAIAYGHEVVVATAVATYSYTPDVEVSRTELLIDGDAANAHSTLGVGSACVRLIDHGDQQLKVESVSMSNPYLERAVYDLDYLSTQDTKIHYIDVYVVLPPAWPIGPVEETVTITTNHPQYRTIQLPLRGEVRGPVKVNPSVILLRDLHLGSRFTREVTLEASSPIVLGPIQPQTKTMTIEATPSDDGRRVVLRISDLVDPDNVWVKDKKEYRNSCTILIKSPAKYRQVIALRGTLSATATGE